MKRLGLAFLFVTTSAIACSGNNNTTTPGTGGTSATAGTTGTAGTSAAGTTGGGGASAGGTGGGTPGFMSIMPCPSESAYVTGTTINFGGSVGFNYDPKCLKVSAGSTVTFSGDFSLHPLQPSSVLGNTTNNPITNVSGLPDGGTMTSFTFPSAGFYAYRCTFHGSDDGMFMSGVIWVQ